MMIRAGFIKSSARCTVPRPALARYDSWRQGSPYKLYNDELRCIFVHVPKVAGLSIVAALFGIAASVQEQPGHRAAWEYRWHDPERFRCYFKFSFVRDPCDRFLSAFRFLRQGGINEPDRRYMEEFIAGCRTPEEFIARLETDSWFRRRALVYHHFRPQADYVCDSSGRVLLDFVGRYERLAKDFMIVRDRLGISANLPWVNRSRLACRAALDPVHRKLLCQLYERDFDIFGYQK